MRARSDQEVFWEGTFGDDYTRRNQGEATVAANMAMFANILSHTDSVSSVIEFGSNAGLNIEAIRRLLPNAALSAIEINTNAVTQLKRIKNLRVYHSSILDFQIDEVRDFVLSKGVLMHIDPDDLQRVYELLYAASCRYICVAEYYNPSPVEVKYRGHDGKLFKRDFAGEMIERFPGLRLIDYGFVYHGDNSFPQDDLTWFLLEKR